IFCLLGLLGYESRLIQQHVFGCLLDLMENPIARLHLLEWRSKDKKKIFNLLIQLWNQEEMKLQVPQEEHGMISNTTHPLNGLNTLNIHSDDIGTAIPEISHNLRAKIYSMFTKLGFDCDDCLSANEKVKLALISKYLDFKIGQVWEEISVELEHEGIRPITPDIECIETSKKVVRRKAEVILEKQKEVIRKKQEVVIDIISKVPN
ncbi:hypothetical protein HK096_000231, partial [Nowakowskiella sp. JEL0078]